MCSCGGGSICGVVCLYVITLLCIDHVALTKFMLDHTLNLSKFERTFTTRKTHQHCGA